MSSALSKRRCYTAQLQTVKGTFTLAPPTVLIHRSDCLEGSLDVVLNTDQGTHLVEFLYHENQNCSDPM
jgi:hypothetical protein